MIVNLIDDKTALAGAAQVPKTASGAKMIITVTTGSNAKNIIPTPVYVVDSTTNTQIFGITSSACVKLTNTSTITIQPLEKTVGDYKSANYNISFIP